MHARSPTPAARCPTCPASTSRRRCPRHWTRTSPVTQHPLLWAGAAAPETWPPPSPSWVSTPSEETAATTSQHQVRTRRVRKRTFNFRPTSSGHKTLQLCCLTNVIKNIFLVLYKNVTKSNHESLYISLKVWNTEAFGRISAQRSENILIQVEFYCCWISTWIKWRNLKPEQILCRTGPPGVTAPERATVLFPFLF